MGSRKLTLAVVAALATMALLAAGGSAQAAYPDTSGCIADPAVVEQGCIHIQSRSGYLNINGFNVPLHESLAIRGAIDTRTEPMTFIPPAGTNGFFGTPVPVPGGLLGIEWIPGNSVLAIAELAGPSSAIKINLFPPTIRIPLKVRLVNVLLGMNCHIGTNSRPVVLTLPTTRPGTVVQTERSFQILGNTNGESSFAIPGATECGLGLGLINSLVNLKLGLPSAAGRNTTSIVNDIGLIRL